MQERSSSAAADAAHLGECVLLDLRVGLVLELNVLDAQGTYDLLQGADRGHTHIQGVG